MQLISIAIPVYNESDGITQLAKRLSHLRSTWKHDVKLEFIFVDDGSSDGTHHGLIDMFGSDPMCQILRHTTNRGVGAAFRTAWQHCHGSIICTIDADCSYGPENLQRLVAVLQQSDADIAVASPYHPEGGVDGVPAWRLMLSKGCSVAYWLVAPVRLYTYTSIFRAYRQRVVESVRYEEDGFVFAAESLIRAAQLGYRVVEVPMTLHTRKFGQTKMKVAQTMCGHLSLLAKTAARRLRTAFRQERVVAREMN